MGSNSYGRARRRKEETVRYGGIRAIVILHNLCRKNRAVRHAHVFAKSEF